MVTGAYHPEISGAGLQCRSLVRAAGGRGIEFAVVTTCRDRALPFRDRVDGVPVYRLHVTGQPSAADFIRWLPKIAYLKFAVFLRAAVVHLHGFSRKSVLFSLFALLPRVRVLLKLTSLGEDDPVSIASRGTLQRAFYRLADRYLVPSPALELAAREGGLPEGKIVPLPNGVDTARFRPAGREEKLGLRSALGLPLDGVLAMFVGHFSDEKRPHLLAECWSRIGDGPVHLLLVGRTAAGSYEVSDLAVERVRSVGQGDKKPGELILVERTDRIEDYYRASDIFALPSVREGLPNALIEAMSCGLACLATRLPGITDLLLDETGAGMTFEPDSENALVSGLNRLAENPTLREILGARGRETALERYDMDRIAARYREICFGLSRKG